MFYISLKDMLYCSKKIIQVALKFLFFFLNIFFYNIFYVFLFILKNLNIINLKLSQLNKYENNERGLILAYNYYKLFNLKKNL